MKKQSVTCPKCSHKFEVSEALEGEIESRLRRKLEKEQDEWREREKLRIERKIKEELKDSIGVKVEHLEQALAEKESALKKAQKSELEVRRKSRELEERIQSVELENQKKLDAERKKIQESAEAKAEEKFKLKIIEQEEQHKSLAAKIEELQRKSEKTSQELQGSAQEIELLEILQKQFPEDGFERVGKGKRGGDVIQTVNSAGRFCARIVWESKRTATYSKAWIDKLRSDRNNEKADLAVLVSETLPESVDQAACVDGIWLCDFKTAPVLATALRNGLIELAGVRSALENRSDMKEIVWRYLTGNDFKQRIERVMRTLMRMKGQIEKEREQSMKWLAERDQQLNLIGEDVNGFRGELEAMLQSALPGAEHLALAAG